MVMAFVHKCLAGLEQVVDRSCYLVAAVVTAVLIDHLYYCWLTLLHIMIAVLLSCGWGEAVAPMAYMRGLAYENAGVSLGSWLYSGMMLAVVEDKPDLVVAVYREDLSWLRRYVGMLNHVYLYCKDDARCGVGVEDLLLLNPEMFTVRYLPNVGREAHTYLTHIQQYYDSMDRRVVFTMGSINQVLGRELSLRYALADSKDMRSCRAMSTKYMDQIADFEYAVAERLSLGDRRKLPVKPAAIRPLSRWFKSEVGIDIKHYKKRCGLGKHGAIFSADVLSIRRIPSAQYARMLLANSMGDSLEQGYFMEYTWRLLLA